MLESTEQLSIVAQLTYNMIYKKKQRLSSPQYYLNKSKRALSYKASIQKDDDDVFAYYIKNELKQGKHQQGIMIDMYYDLQHFVSNLIDNIKCYMKPGADTGF